MFGFLNHAIFATALTVIGLAIFYGCISPATRRIVGYRWAAGALALPVVGFLAPHVLVLHAFLLLFVPVLARSRQDVAPLFLIGALLLPGIQLPTMIGSFYLMQFSTITSLAIGALLTMAMRPGKSRGPNAFDLSFLVILLLVVIFAARGLTETNALRLMASYTLVFLPPYYILSRTVRVPEDARRTMLGLAFVGIVCTPLLVFEAVRFWPMYIEIANRHGLSMPTVANIRAGFMRANGPQLQPTATGFVNVVCLLAIYMLRNAFRSKVHWGAALGAVAIGLVALQSRNAWIGAVLGIVVAEIFRGKIGRVGGLVIIGGIAVATFLATVPLTGRIKESIGDGAGTGDYRAELFRRGMEELPKDRWLGASKDVIDSRLSDMVQGEGFIDYVNTYLFFALHTGLVGLAAFVAALALPLLLLVRGRGRFRQSEAAMITATFAFAGLATVIQMLVFTSFFGGPTQITMLILALAAAMLSLKAEALSGEPARGRSRRPRPAPVGRLPALRR